MAGYSHLASDTLWESLQGTGVTHSSSWQAWSELKRGFHHLLLCSPPVGPGLGLNSY